MKPTMRTNLPHEWRPSPNIGPRRGGIAPDILLLHYTGMKSAASARDWLCSAQSRVSCHYLVDEEGAITQMADEMARAWHAGVSCWEGESDINSRSIGIEIQNPGHDFGYCEFPERQISVIIELIRDIAGRHAIVPHHVLAHSDVAVGRKIDPGEKFPWHVLHQAGIGQWVEPAPLELKSAAPLNILRMQAALGSYGYCVLLSGTHDRQSQGAVEAFQRHFRPALIDGSPDPSTLDTLERLSRLRHGGLDEAAARIDRFVREAMTPPKSV